MIIPTWIKEAYELGILGEIFKLEEALSKKLDVETYLHKWGIRKSKGKADMVYFTMRSCSRKFEELPFAENKKALAEIVAECGHKLQSMCRGTSENEYDVIIYWGEAE